MALITLATCINDQFNIDVSNLTKLIGDAKVVVIKPEIFDMFNLTDKQEINFIGYDHRPGTFNEAIIESRKYMTDVVVIGDELTIMQALTCPYITHIRLLTDHPGKYHACMGNLPNQKQFAKLFPSLTENTHDKTISLENTDELKYLSVLERMLDANERPNRTATPTRGVFHEYIEFNLSDIGGRILPLITTKKVPFDSVFEELKMFIHGETTNLRLKEKNIKIWDGNSSREYLDSIGLTDYPEGTLGPVYGSQWRSFGGSGIDQLQKVIDTLKSNPGDRRMLVSAWNPIDIPKMVLPACFMPNTNVLTYDGYKKIQDVLKTDLLMTHDGTFKPINEIHITQYDDLIMNVKLGCHPHIIKTTPEHPFWARKKIDNSNKYDIPYWVSASELTLEHQVGMKINTNTIIPTFTRKLKRKTRWIKEDIVTKIDNPDQWFMLGYFLGDGWLNHNDEKNYPIYFIFNNEDMEISFPIISRVLHLMGPYRESDNYRYYYAKNCVWWLILRDFGQLAHNKKVPQWVHDAPVEMLEHFIKGYHEADGRANSETTNTVSTGLAFDIQMIYAKLGKTVNVAYENRPSTCMIMGKLRNQRGKYNMSVITMKLKHKSIIENDMIWFPVLDNNADFKGVNLVYNFDVADNHTYVVENLIVHNCHYSFQFHCDFKKLPDGTFKPSALNCLVNMRSADTALGVPFNIASYAMLTHIVSLIVNIPPGKIGIVMADCHVYENHIEGIKRQLKRRPKRFPYIKFMSKINTIDDVDDLKFNIVGYAPDPYIKLNMAV